MVLPAAFDVLMARLSGSDDVVVGTRTAGRTHGPVAGSTLAAATPLSRLSARSGSGMRSTALATAGTGHFCLRLYDPAGVPSMLLVTPEQPAVRLAPVDAVPGP